MYINHANIYTVSRLNAEVRLLLESEMGIIWLVGEISNFTKPVSGHWYFTLKDSKAQVKCAMFKGNNRFVTMQPSHGNQVLVRARLSLYEPRGDYQMIVESMQPEGDGLLQQAFEQLKMKLSAEGLFAQDLKKKLPESVKRVGVITSKTGAALHDILNVLRRRDPTLAVVIYPTQVQGKEAAIQVAQAIGCANSRQECDVLIVGRGGGSLEDLWCFNDEVLARTIAASQIPIISAVGHETDFTIADFVADVRAPTPSAAAELVSQDLRFKTQQILQKQQQLKYCIKQALHQHKQEFETLSHRLALKHPKAMLQQQAQQLDEASRMLQFAIENRLRIEQHKVSQYQNQVIQSSPKQTIQLQKQHLNQMQKNLITQFQQTFQQHKHLLYRQIEMLDTLSPLATLSRGYSITKNTDGDLIQNTTDIKTGDLLITELQDGTLISRVEKSHRQAKISTSKQEKKV